jgi:hypothetical protein
MPPSSTSPSDPSRGPTIIQEATDRGELPARTPPDPIIDAIMGPPPAC